MRRSSEKAKREGNKLKMEENPFHTTKMANGKENWKFRIPQRHDLNNLAIVKNTGETKHIFQFCSLLSGCVTTGSVIKCKNQKCCNEVFCHTQHPLCSYQSAARPSTSTCCCCSFQQETILLY